MKQCILEAKKAIKNSYSPYSKFAVGAAIKMKDGNFIHGANIENGSFGLSNCAERSALFAAYSMGYKKDDIISLTVIANDKGPVSPCGACRQVMYELLPDDAEIILTNFNDEIKIVTKFELLPYGFILD